MLRDSEATADVAKSERQPDRRAEPRDLDGPGPQARSRQPDPRRPHEDDDQEGEAGRARRARPPERLGGELLGRLGRGPATVPSRAPATRAGAPRCRHPQSTRRRRRTEVCRLVEQGTRHEVQVSETGRPAGYRRDASGTTCVTRAGPAVVPTVMGEPAADVQACGRGEAGEPPRTAAGAATRSATRSTGASDSPRDPTRSAWTSLRRPPCRAGRPATRAVRAGMRPTAPSTAASCPPDPGGGGRR